MNISEFYDQLFCWGENDVRSNSHIKDAAQIRLLQVQKRLIVI